MEEKFPLRYYVVDGPYSYHSAKFIQKRIRERLGLEFMVKKPGQLAKRKSRKG